MRLLAMQNAMPVRAASESIEDYNKRMAQWKDELKAKQKAENSEILQGLIAGVDTKISTDIHSLKNTNSAIEKLKFWQYVLEGYDTNLDSQISALKAKQGLIQQQIEKIKNRVNRKKSWISAMDWACEAQQKKKLCSHHWPLQKRACLIMMS